MDYWKLNTQLTVPCPVIYVKVKHRCISHLKWNIWFVWHFILQWKAAYLNRQNASCVKNVQIHHQWIVCSMSAHDGWKHLGRHLFSNSVSLLFIFDVNILHRTGIEIRVCVCVDMHSESLYAELTGNIAKTCRYTANNAKRWLKIHPPTHPSPLKTTAAWRFALKSKGSHSFVSVWKGISTETNDSSHKVKGFLFFSAEFACSLTLSLQPSDSSLGTN